jgi:hypothetical protein
MMSRYFEYTMLEISSVAFGGEPCWGKADFLVLRKRSRMPGVELEGLTIVFLSSDFSHNRLGLRNQSTLRVCNLTTAWWLSPFQIFGLRQPSLDPEIVVQRIGRMCQEQRNG